MTVLTKNAVAVETSCTLYIHRVKAVPCFQMHCLVDTCSYCVPCSVFLDIPRHHDKNYYGALLLLYRSTVTALIRSKLIQLAYLAGSIKGGEGHDVLLPSWLFVPVHRGCGTHSNEAIMM